ncbi:MAG: transposase [Calditrichaeota bacterium]|nr:transposase [Calditrichota bacterium]MCB0266666.1 transposase [Calditrichota bacterium]
MNWQLQLITLYDHIDTFYHSELWVYCQRMSNNSSSSFSDVEAITIYLFGIIKKQREVIDIYSYTRNHLSDWFPNLPAYSVYIRRLNYICEVFAPLIEKILETFPQTGVFKDIKLIDSMPIILASARRSNQAKIVSEFANKSYCASKGIYYYGVKLHILASRRPGKLPVADYIALTPASDNDLKTLEIILPQLYHGQLYADKAYIKQLLHEITWQKQYFQILTPVKKKKGQIREPDYLEKILSTAVSSVQCASTNRVIIQLD